MIHEPLVVTGIGIVSPIGVGQHAFFEALSAGEHGIRAVDRFPTDRYRSHLAATLPAAWMATHAPEQAPIDPAAAMAIVAGREALGDARLDGDDVARERIAIVLGTSAGGFSSRSQFELGVDLDDDRRHAALSRCPYHVQTAEVAVALGIRGPRLTVSTACTSSTHALGSARLLLDAGDADVVLVGGVDVLVEAIFAGFHAMGAMSSAPCSPFSTPVGMTTGEGAGFLVVERGSSARARGAKIRCFVNGFAASSDAHHATAPDPTGRGLSRALSGALADAGITPGEVDWISAHGTGTDANDASEWRAIQRVFGERATHVPVSAAKSFFGHALGAAGALELAAAILALERQVVPPTLHHRGSRFAGPMDAVADVRARPYVHRHVLKSASAFGGINAAVVVSSIPAKRRPWRDDDVVILGGSAFGAHGISGLDVALRSERAPERDASGVACAPKSELDAAAAAFIDVRALDCLGRHLAVLARWALDDSHVHIRGALHDRAGILLGAPTMAWDTLDEFWDTVRKRGFERVSVPAFSRTVMSAPAGAVARAIGLRGHASVLASGPISGLLAAIEASRTLASAQRDLDLLLVASAYEMGEALRWDHARRHPSGRPTAGESGACLVLARREWALSHGAPRRARIGAAAVVGPGQLAAAIARVLDTAELRPDVVFVASDGTDAGRARVDAALSANDLSRVPQVDPGVVLGYGESNDACALLAAVERMRDRAVDAALVVTEAEAVGGAVLALIRDRE